MVDFKKMAWFQRRHAERYVSERGPDFDQMVGNILASLQQDGLVWPWGKTLQEHVTTVLQEEPKAYTSAKDFIDHFGGFFYWTMEDQNRAKEPLRNPELTKQVYSRLRYLTKTQWTRERISKIINDALSEYCDGDPSRTHESQRNPITKALMQDLRQLIMGSRPGPGVPICMELLGRYNCIARLHLGESGDEQLDLEAGDGRRSSIVM